ncbi:MAG: hypothetical protein EXR72_16645 [Myxococcales bacterium]|nr:hypothetical protein [Myxococcales bacterium]
MESKFCERGSGWACNELGILATERQAETKTTMAPAKAFDLACRRGLQAGCGNALRLGRAPGALRHVPPSPEDYNLIIEDKHLPVDRETIDRLIYSRRRARRAGSTGA